MVEIKEKTIDNVLKILKPYLKGCEHTSKNSSANMVQRNGAKMLARNISKVIDDIESQLL